LTIGLLISSIMLAITSNDHSSKSIVTTFFLGAITVFRKSLSSQTFLPILSISAWCCKVKLNVLNIFLAVLGSIGFSTIESILPHSKHFSTFARLIVSQILVLPL